MTREEFEHLLDKKLKGLTTREEDDLLEQFGNHLYPENTSVVFRSDEEKRAIYRELRSRVQPPVKSFSWLKVAASVLLFIGLSFTAWYGLRREHTTYKTSFGERAAITLNDGTVVQLNAQSSLKYPLEFSGHEREVYLSGEAYFKVAKEAERPFVVITNGVKTTVLGTEFNFSAYPEDSVTTVALLEGSVAVEGSDNHKVLEPGQQACFDLNKGTMEVRPFSPGSALVWQKNHIVFERTSYRQAARIIKRQFGVDLNFEKPHYKDFTISGRFEEARLRVVLEAISKAKGLNYKKINKKEYLLYADEN